MQINTPTLFIEINKSEFIFLVGKLDENNIFEIIHKNKKDLKGIIENKVINFEEIKNIIKDQLYNLEQKSDFIFKEVILVINNFDCSIINFSGFKKLNGSQLNKENITYILNVLKTKISEIEKKKTILHIFNSKFILDQKNIENLPIGLFGNFYSHELSFFLINTNDYKNLQNIFNKSNLRIKKIISKNFAEGVNLISQNDNLKTFFQIDISKNSSQIFLFENFSLKFFQDFKFGTDLIVNDIAKITYLNKDIIKNILNSSNLMNYNKENFYLEKTFFEEKNFRKIKKELIFDISKARIQELSEIMLLKNINCKNFLKINAPIFLRISEKSIYKNFEDCFKLCFSNKNSFKFQFYDVKDDENFFKNVYEIVQYGWKKEAVPVVFQKKSIITRLFDLMFR